MAVNLDSKHPEFSAWINSWSLMRDTVDGEESVKDKGDDYLPIPSGFTEFEADVATKAYAAYKKRAQFPDIVAPTIRGMVGVIHRRPSQITLPEALEPMREKTSRDGLTLESFHRRITREVLITGRYGVLPDLPADGGQPYLAGYTAESIPNWGEDEDKELTFVMLDESGSEFDEDTLDWSDIGRWRLLRLKDGVYIVEEYRRTETGNTTINTLEPSIFGGEKLAYIPFVFIDTNDLTAEPDEVPLLGLGRIALSIYRLDADYRNQLFMSGQEMLIYSGAKPEDVPAIIGSGLVVTLPKDCTAQIIGPQGRGIEAHRVAIQDDFKRAVQQGARLFEENTKQAESGESRKIKTANQTATLTGIAKNVAAGLEHALRHCAVWIGADPDEVEVMPNLEFADVDMTPQDIAALVEAWQSEAFSKATLWANLQRGGVADPERTLEEEQELINEEITGGMGVPNPEEQGLLDAEANKGRFVEDGTGLRVNGKPIDRFVEDGNGLIVHKKDGSVVS